MSDDAVTAALKVAYAESLPADASKLLGGLFRPAPPVRQSHPEKRCPHCGSYLEEDE